MNDDSLDECKEDSEIIMAAEIILKSIQEQYMVREQFKGVDYKSKISNHEWTEYEPPKRPKFIAGLNPYAKIHHSYDSALKESQESIEFYSKWGRTLNEHQVLDAARKLGWEPKL